MSVNGLPSISTAICSAPCVSVTCAQVGRAVESKRTTSNARCFALDAATFMLGISIGTAAQMRGAIQWGWLQTLGDEAGDVKLVTACILAASFPALRAARIDPIVRATALCGASPELARQVGGRSGKVCSMNVATVVDLGP